MHLLLNQAEREWRGEVHRDFPLRSDTPVVRKSKANGRDWEFSTDLKRIFATISNDEGLRKKYETVVAKYWDGDPEELARDTLHYLLFHELYHPIEAPFSVSGENNDNKRIHQAIRRGLLKAEPDLSPLEQVVKVQLSQNGVKDFILDNRFYIDNQERDYVRNDIIPAWDVLELQEAPSRTNFYTVTRFMYGVLYGPESACGFFEGKAGKNGAEVAEQALKALLGQSVELPRQKASSLLSKAKATFSSESGEETRQRIQTYVSAIREVFSGEDRYKGIERFMAVLGKYVEKGMPQGRPDQQGAEAGTSPQNILQDLLDDMSPEEQAQFVSGLAEGEDSEQFSDGQADSVADVKSSEKELSTLDVFAIHEFYKRNHPSVKIVGGKKVGESVVVGKQEYWDLTKSTVLTEDQLGKLNLDHIARFQKRTRLPMLIPLENGMYRLNEYKLRQRDVKDIVYVDAHMDVPDVVEFYLDSSGSMYQHGGEFGFNDCSRWDMLSNVLYGFVDALHQGSRHVRKPCKMRIHNFADRQVSSPLISVDQFWSGDTETLGTLFKPRNGYSVEDINISAYNDSQRRVYVVVTDGNLVISGRTEREARKMRELAKSPHNDVVLFEIGGTYDLGNAVKSDASIRYHPVYDKNKMLQEGLEVLLAK
jgi:hypothetical protein